MSASGMEQANTNGGNQQYMDGTMAGQGAMPGQPGEGAAGGGTVDANKGAATEQQQTAEERSAEMEREIAREDVCRLAFRFEQNTLNAHRQDSLSHGY
ncbi:unnamed protein product [Gongylonema pulchrum]|uniref:Catalase n=1 Tax=Gongylonema pulchrum TaxID=637853 RepID=A0A183DMS3_9BILA|nr:unnamed protein product [Gongylonema pulchrum]